MRSEADILKDINNFQPTDGEWRGLDDLLSELWEIGVPESSLPILFNIFERFPDEDGAGVLWSIVHGVEALDYDYEKYLKDSLDRKPSFMGNIMLKRLEKANAS
ncbi:MAG: hypothetical protein PVJ72_16770 [Gammaproteobacteria bacterium]|jgi:hypothetical protein